MKPVRFDKKISFPIDEDTMQQLDYIVKSTGLSKSAVIRRGIQMYFDWLSSPDGKKALQFISGSGV